MSVFYLEGEQFDGGGGAGPFHRSCHRSLDMAKAKAEAQVTDEDRAGEDAINEWRSEEYKKQSDPYWVCEFRTNIWGFKVFAIWEIPLED